jgi:hypothetical protein
MEAPTGGSGRRRHRGPVGELNLHGTCAPPVMHQLYGTLRSTSGQSAMPRQFIWAPTSEMADGITVG